jgi:hypothetical protein
MRCSTGKPPYSIWSYSKPTLARRHLVPRRRQVCNGSTHSKIGNPAACPMASIFEFALTTAVVEQIDGFLVGHVGCLSENDCMANKGWPRDRSTGPGGGLSTGPGGGLSTGPGGGMSTGPGGGLSTGPGGGMSTGPGGGLSTGPGGGMSTGPGGGLSPGPRGGLSSGTGGGLSSGPGGGLSTGGETHYYRNIPPIHVFVPYLRKNGYGWAADMLARAHHLRG